MDTDTAGPKARTPYRRLLDWYAQHPGIGLLGTVASVISIPITVVLFFLAQKDRDIRYAVSASPTTIVRAGQSSDLRVQFRNKELTSDVSSIQVAIWNTGKESVKQENILSETVSLKLEPPTSILEARIKRTTRDVVNFRIDSSSSSRGILKLSWSILEQGDGAVLELIYTGTSEQVLLDGAIEGKLPIKRVLLEHDPDPSYRGDLMRIAGIGALIALLRSIKKYRLNRPTMNPLAAMISAVADGIIWGMLGFCLLFLATGVYVVLTRPSIPFSL